MLPKKSLAVYDPNKSPKETIGLVPHRQLRSWGSYNDEFIQHSRAAWSIGKFAPFDV